MSRWSRTSGTRRWRAWTKSAALMLLAIAPTPILASCANPTVTVPPSAGTVFPKAPRPFSCNEFKVVNPHLGKVVSPITKEDVIARLALPDWPAQLSRLFGDTDDTIKAVKGNNAAWHALCD